MGKPIGFRVEVLKMGKPIGIWQQQSLGQTRVSDMLFGETLVPIME